jgi:hypothetical protein
VTSAEFLRRFPEFDSAGPSLVVAKLTEASARLSGDAFVTPSLDLAQGYLAAHLLWSSPFGASMRLDGAGEELASPYWGEFERLRLERVPRVIVL